SCRPHSRPPGATGAAVGGGRFGRGCVGPRLCDLRRHAPLRRRWVRRRRRGRYGRRRARRQRTGTGGPVVEAAFLATRPPRIAPGGNTPSLTLPRERGREG